MQDMNQSSEKHIISYLWFLSHKSAG